MRFFMVALKDAGGDGDPKRLIEKLDKDRFPETIEFIEGHVWLVLAGTPTVTTADLVDAVAPDEDQDSWPLLFVVKTDAFNGIAGDSVWEKLRAWQEVSA